MTDQFRTAPVFSGSRAECMPVWHTLCECGLWTRVEAAGADDPCCVSVMEQDRKRADGIVRALKKLKG